MRNFKNYIVGYALADGHLTKYNTGIFASKKDLENLKTINKKYPESFIRHYPSHNAYCLTIQDKKLNQYLRKYIPIGNKTKFAGFPNGNKDSIKDFVLGFLDGDGSFFVLGNGRGSKYTVTSFVAGNPYILESLMKRLNILGLKTKRVGRHKESETYRIVFSQGETKTLVKQLYNDIDYGLKRKFLRIMHLMEESL